MTEQLTPRDPADESEMASTVLHRENPDAGRLYFEAKAAFREMLDSSDRPWQDAIMMLYDTARHRRAIVLEAELDLHHAALMRSAKHQDISDQWTDHADAMDRIKANPLMDDYYERGELL